MFNLDLDGDHHFLLYLDRGGNVDLNLLHYCLVVFDFDCLFNLFGYLYGHWNLYFDRYLYFDWHLDHLRHFDYTFSVARSASARWLATATRELALARAN